MFFGLLIAAFIFTSTKAGTFAGEEKVYFYSAKLTSEEASQAQRLAMGVKEWIFTLDGISQGQAKIGQAKVDSLAIFLLSKFKSDSTIIKK